MKGGYLCLLYSFLSFFSLWERVSLDVFGGDKQRIHSCHQNLGS